MDTPKEKICKNCRYFHKHYTGHSKVSFVFANNVCTYQLPVYVKEKHYCGYWQERELPNCVQHRAMLEETMKPELKEFYEEVRKAIDGKEKENEAD